MPSSLTFNSGETEKTFTFSATDDTIDDDGEGVTIGFGTPLPGIIRQGSVFETALSIVDDDATEISISETALAIDEGATQTYTVVLTSQPTGDVTVTLEGSAGTDLSLDTADLTFTDRNWDVPQSVALTAAEDDDAVDEPLVTITHTVVSAADSRYDGLPADSVDVTVIENDMVGVEVVPKRHTLHEGSNHLLSMRLTSQPTGDVHFTIGTLDPDWNLVFTPQNWNVFKRTSVYHRQDTTTNNTALYRINARARGESDYQGVRARARWRIHRRRSGYEVFTGGGGTG